MAKDDKPRLRCDERGCDDAAVCKLMGPDDEHVGYFCQRHGLRKLYVITQPKSERKGG